MRNDSSKPHKVYAKRSFGQNFLVEQQYIRQIIDAASITADDTVVEIGPGRGALTGHLVETAGKVIAVELDSDLIPILEREFGKCSNFELLPADVLKLDLSKFASGTKLKLVANLPYYISTAVLQHLINNRQYFSTMVLMFQREVVERIVAEPGNSERGYLTVLVQTFLNVEKLFDVPPSAFKPSPKVWSSVVRMNAKNIDSVLMGKEQRFERLISAAFKQKRKTILNNLKASSSELKVAEPAVLLEASEIEPSRRAESLSLEDWMRLFRVYST